MTHSANFEKVEYYFSHGYWSESRVRNVVGRWITAEEFEEIVGKPYAG